MSTSITIRRYLDRQDVRYATIPCDDIETVIHQGSDDIPADHIAKAVILKDLRGMVMAVIPGPHHLDLDALNRQLHRNLRAAEAQDYHGIFAGYATSAG
jgi:Ala-tRNA(Pro) deacylase